MVKGFFFLIFIPIISISSKKLCDSFVTSIWGYMWEGGGEPLRQSVLTHIYLVFLFPLFRGTIKQDGLYSKRLPYYLNHHPFLCYFHLKLSVFPFCHTTYATIIFFTKERKIFYVSIVRMRKA